jgi:pyruvate/2-oxoglutarate dehydrogenase complex dihydrolipoamide acyltransferase (E2) component
MYPSLHELHTTFEEGMLVMRGRALAATLKQACRKLGNAKRSGPEPAKVGAAAAPATTLSAHTLVTGLFHDQAAQKIAIQSGRGHAGPYALFPATMCQGLMRISAAAASRTAQAAFVIARCVQRRALDRGQIMKRGMADAVSKKEPLQTMPSEQFWDSVFEDLPHGREVPDSKEGVTILRWHKRPRDAVEVGDKILDVEAAGITLEMKASVSGFLGQHGAAEGAFLPRGRPVATILREPQALADVDDDLLNYELSNSEGSVADLHKALDAVEAQRTKALDDLVSACRLAACYGIADGASSWFCVRVPGHSHSIFTAPAGMHYLELTRDVMLTIGGERDRRMARLEPSSAEAQTADVPEEAARGAAPGDVPAPGASSSPGQHLRRVQSAIMSLGESAIKSLGGGGTKSGPLPVPSEAQQLSQAAGAARQEREEALRHAMLSHPASIVASQVLQQDTSANCLLFARPTYAAALALRCPPTQLPSPSPAAPPSMLLSRAADMAGMAPGEVIVAPRGLRGDEMAALLAVGVGGGRGEGRGAGEGAGEGEGGGKGGKSVRVVLFSDGGMVVKGKSVGLAFSDLVAFEKVWGLGSRV